MAEITLESLGISQNEIVERVVERIADRVLSEWVDVGEDEQVVGHTKFAQMLEDKVLARVNESIDEIAAKNVLPNVATYVENLTLQETNKWGEKKGQSLTFREYLVQRAEHYMTETVNYEGKSQSENNNYGWNGTQTRIAHMIHKHLHYNIESAMKEALANVNNSIAKGLRDTVSMKIQEVANSLKVKVETR